jgi:hypothetical protein
MTGVQTVAGGVRELGEHVVLGAGVAVNGGVELGVGPDTLPFWFDILR